MQGPKISHLIPGRATDFYCLLIYRARMPLQIQKTEEKPLSALLQQPTITHFTYDLRRQRPGTTAITRPYPSRVREREDARAGYRVA